MKKNNISIGHLFELLNNESAKDNAFITEIGDTIFEETVNLMPHNNIDEEFESCEKLGELVITEREQAFKVGFRAAVSLFCDVMSV